jgi:hypothetical protein
MDVRLVEKRDQDVDIAQCNATVTTPHPAAR